MCIIIKNYIDNPSIFAQGGMQNIKRSSKSSATNKHVKSNEGVLKIIYH